MTAAAHDPDTLAFYEREAVKYAARRLPLEHPALAAFLARLPPGAKVLELGCGGGQDAEVMLAAGMDVEPTDGSSALARAAEARLGRPVRVMRFDELEAAGAFDAVWANACLLHVPEAELAGILTRVFRALRPGGIFHASFKSGDGGGRDELGRYYNFPSEAKLRADYAAAGDWAALEFTIGEGGGYDGVARTWIAALAIRA